MAEVQKTTIDELIERYSYILFDAYGVLSHSSGALTGAVELIAHLNQIGKPYYVLTNDSSMLPENRAKRYQGYGLAIEPERYITSGSLLNAHFQENDLHGARCVVLGTEDSGRYVEQAGGRVVSATDDFDAVVVGDQSGFPFVETLNDVVSSLYIKIDQGEKIHLVLPNPDLVYLRSTNGFGIASGSVALIIEAALELRYPNKTDLKFERLGKPHAAIYREAHQRSGTMNMVMIGDQIETDIRGANAFGISSALISTGVATMDFNEMPDHLRPTYSLDSLMPPR